MRYQLLKRSSLVGSVTAMHLQSSAGIGRTPASVKMMEITCEFWSRLMADILMCWHGHGHTHKAFQ